MAKLKITVSNPIEIDVEFPLYIRVSDYLVCKIFSENTNGIIVSDYGNNTFSIQHCNSLPNEWLVRPVIPKEEFDAEFKKVQDKINQLI